MLVKFEDIKRGDEIITPSYSKLKYLKVLYKTKSGNLKCSVFKDTTSTSWLKNSTVETDVSKHNNFVYIKDEGIYRDFWLVKRENG